MGQPDGGWYDETPPQVIGTEPAEGGLNVNSKKIYINFDEYINLTNATENVIVSPPQMEAPEIKTQGKRIVVQLNDELKPNTTYTIDFSDAITDFTEDNPLGNYTFTFSTGDVIDTMEVSGYVLDAENLEPVKGILVGLYENQADSAFQKQPMLRVARTNDSGRFVVRGIKGGSYRIYALQDVDGDFTFSQKSEKIAFLTDLIVPSAAPDVRQDTLWRDSLHIENINRVNYTHYFPDDITLRAFTEEQTDRYLVKSERKTAQAFTLFFSYGSDKLPEIRGLNYDSSNAFLVEPSEKNDTITYWLRDTTLVNQDTLTTELIYEETDTNGVLQMRTDTLTLLSKEPYEKRMKAQQRKYEQWKKTQEKKERRGEAFQTVMAPDPLESEKKLPSAIAPDDNPVFDFKTPIARVDESKIHLYSKIDTLWYNAPFRVKQDAEHPRQYKLLAEWRPDTEYSIELDSAAFVDLYGKATVKTKQGMKVKSNDDFATILVTIDGAEGKPQICQLLNESDKVVKEVKVNNHQAEFFYVMPQTYYLRLLVDDNDNGRWDTGDYATKLQPEMVYYYPEKLECRAKWDLTLTWNVNAKKLFEQKPDKLKKQKSEKKKQTVKSRNQERARKLGIEYIPK